MEREDGVLSAKLRSRLGRSRVGRRLRPGVARPPDEDEVIAQLARHNVRDVEGVRAAIVEFGGAVYYVPASSAHRPVAQKILHKHQVETRLHTLVEMVMDRRPGSMIHAGAFFGDMLPSFSSKTTGTLYAFEPVLEHYVLARAAVESNGLRNVKLLHAGLSKESGRGTMMTRRKGRDLGGAARLISGLAQPEQGPQDVELLTIDQLEIPDLSIIQLDVEGWELPALRGGVRTIREQRPVIVVEDNKERCSQFLRRLGYSEVAQLDRDHVYMTNQAATDFSALLR